MTFSLSLPLWLWIEPRATGMELAVAQRLTTELPRPLPRLNELLTPLFCKLSQTLLWNLQEGVRPCPWLPVSFHFIFCLCHCVMFKLARNSSTYNWESWLLFWAREAVLGEKWEKNLSQESCPPPRLLQVLRYLNTCGKSPLSTFSSSFAYCGLHTASYFVVTCFILSSLECYCFLFNFSFSRGWLESCFIWKLFSHYSYPFKSYLLFLSRNLVASPSTFHG